VVKETGKRKGPIRLRMIRPSESKVIIEEGDNKLGMKVGGGTRTSTCVTGRGYALIKGRN